MISLPPFGSVSLRSVSFEFFPPLNPETEQRLWKTVDRLVPFSPDFVSVTYGAGGSTRIRTHAIVEKLHQTGLPVAAHLTCIGSDRAEIEEIALTYWELGVRHIVALRGDPPAQQDGTAYRPSAHGYANAAELVGALCALRPFELSVAAYPEMHPEATSWQADIDNLKRKFDNGASRAITQFFFDVEVYLRFRDRCAQNGITQPIVPGILPVTNLAQLQRFAALCGASIPGWLVQYFGDSDLDTEVRMMIATAIAVEQCRKLAEEGVEAFHFYTLNRSQLCEAICRVLGLIERPAEARNSRSND